MKYRIFIVTDEKVAILQDETGQIHKYEPPYKKCEQTTYGEYFQEIYCKNGGTIYPKSCSTPKSLEEIQEILLNKEKETTNPGKIIHEFLTWLLEDQGTVICKETTLYPVATWKTYGPTFFTEKYLRQEIVNKPLGVKE